MSVSKTTEAVRSRKKTVTRRLGWQFLKPGDHLTLCKKVQGRKKGEPLERIAEVEVISVRREPLLAITDEDVAKEAVPTDCFEMLEEQEDGTWQPPTHEWVRWFSEELGLDPSHYYEQMVTRIEWRYR